jgi:putative ABC transport system permease protein
MSHVVSTRTREIGVRLALGAQRGDIIRMILGQTLRVVTAASVVGVIVVSFLDTSLGTLLFEVKPGDPRTLIGAVAVLIVTALTAGYVPVPRALAQNPVGSLRAE